MSSWENYSQNDTLRLAKTLYYRKLLKQAASLAVLAVRLVPCQHPLQVEPGEAHGVCLLQLPEAIQQLSAVGAVVKVIRMLQPIAYQRQHLPLCLAGGQRLRLLDGCQCLLPVP